VEKSPKRRLSQGSHNQNSREGAKEDTPSPALQFDQVDKKPVIKV